MIDGGCNQFANDFRRMATELSDKVALVDALSDCEISYADLQTLVYQAAQSLDKTGVEPGMTVACCLPNSVAHVVYFLAALRYGYNFAPISEQARPAEIISWLKYVDAQSCIVSTVSDSELVAAIELEGIKVLKTDLSPAISGNRDNYIEGELKDSQQSGRLYISTSGTTGEPKAIVLGGDRLWAASAQWVETHRFLGPHSRFYNCLPMAYLGGLFNLALIPLAAGGSFVVASAFSGVTALTFWQEISRFEVNILWVVPTIIRSLLAIEHRSGGAGAKTVNSDAIKRFGFVGTAPISNELKQEFEDTFGITLLENYGLSETTFITSETLDRVAGGAQRGIGELWPMLEYRLKRLPDQEVTENKLAYELEVKTPFMFLGYLRDDQQLDLPCSEDGYFPTGDLVEQTEDGQLLLTGRRKEIVKKGGYLVALREIEVVAERNECVKEAAAVGVPHEFFGEDIELYVISACDLENKELIESVRSTLMAGLAKYKWPGKIKMIDDFPRTSSGKIKKYLLAGRA